MNKKLKAFIRDRLPGTIRPHCILGGPLRGFRIVTSWHDYPAAITGRTERPLLQWFAQNVRPGTTWLDVGAYYGYTAIALSNLVGPQGRVFAFEPMVSTAGYLSQTRLLNRLPQLTVMPMALGDTESIEHKELPTVRGMVDSTLKIRAGTEQCSTWHEDFTVARLDWLWPKICGERPQIDGVKIDVQGMEIEALRGMLNVLKSFKPKLVVEVHQGVDRSKLLDIVREIGYSHHGSPVEPVIGEVEVQYLDNHSYIFQAV